jgi:hypothetical protein
VTREHVLAAARHLRPTIPDGCCGDPSTCARRWRLWASVLCGCTTPRRASTE